MALSTHSRALGAIWGTCVGDALGGPVQFSDPGTFEPIKELEFVKPFNQPSGSYSDDGSMTLALAQSFVDSNGQYDHALSIQNYLDWFNSGRFSTTTKAWDLGRSTRVALRIWKARGLDDLPLTQQKVSEQLNKEASSGNGSLMRISPVGVALWKDKDRAKRLAREQSLVTHPALACPDACEAYTEVICMAMSGHTKEDLCKAIAQFRFTHPALISRFARYASIADWKAKPPADIASSGWVVDTLEVALWGFFKYDTWEAGALAVVNLGGDSDTAGAVYGGLAGVFYGYGSIPTRWVEGMQNGRFIGNVAGKFAEIVPSV
ncbi:ADP-ribosylglycohydrolase family protein [Penicillium brasilianum]|uniref:ADP-ribosylhydrolase ARH3 n=1 Tax=Penicillium brasilianum TaxID=104259 RepID=A0A1S9RDB9_PENBI|nr:ADP-ribosylglycohydrolase family protein [Penicillium brasilianum]